MNTDDRKRIQSISAPAMPSSALIPSLIPPLRHSDKRTPGPLKRSPPPTLLPQDSLLLIPRKRRLHLRVALPPPLIKRLQVQFIIIMIRRAATIHNPHPSKAICQQRRPPLLLLAPFMPQAATANSQVVDLTRGHVLEHSRSTAPARHRVRVRQRATSGCGLILPRQQVIQIHSVGGMGARPRCRQPVSSSSSSGAGGRRSRAVPARRSIQPLDLGHQPERLAKLRHRIGGCSSGSGSLSPEGGAPRGTPPPRPAARPRRQWYVQTPVAGRLDVLLLAAVMMPRGAMAARGRSAAAVVVTDVAVVNEVF